MSEEMLVDKYIIIRHARQQEQGIRTSEDMADMWDD